MPGRDLNTLTAEELKALQDNWIRAAEDLSPKSPTLVLIRSRSVEITKILQARKEI